METSPIEIASNAESSSDSLSSLENQSVEVNRLIAAHPKATPDLIAKVIEYRDQLSNDYDSETRQTAIRNPNISIDDALRLAREFPDDLFMNPAFNAIVAAQPKLFDGEFALLQAQGCPIDVLRRFAHTGTRAEQAAVARNPGLPSDLRDLLTAEYFYQRDLKELAQITARQDDEIVRNFVNMYAGTTRPFCTPRFLPLDRLNPEHRIADQVFCGFPFTSTDFPWPVEKLGNHMQPIAQINLKNAADLLGLKLGGGLLQLWGGTDSSQKVELQIRVIPEISMSSALDWFYPEQAPWLNSGYDFSGCAHSAIEQMDFQPFGLDCCRIEWHAPRKMFYPMFGKRIFNPREDDRLKHDLYDRWDEFDSELEELESEADAACVSRHSSFKEAWGEEPLVFLGGYAEALGNAWDRYPGNMLFYHSLDYGSMMTVGITYRIAKNGTVKFDANWTCDN